MAAGTAAALGPLLRSLPEPRDAPGKTPYAALVTPATRLVVGVTVFAALAVSVIALPWPQVLALLPLGTGGVLAAVIDARTTYLPRSLVWGATAGLALCVGVVAALTGDWQVPVLAAGGSLLVGGLFWLLWRTTGGFGFGDVRLALLAGGTAGTLGVSAALWAALLGALVGAAWGLACQVSDRGAGRPPGPFPYGPSLVAGPYLWLVWTMLPGW
ncbi:prepilin peptidase [Propionicicella superfundia]|uniref:prepilin peptidase n=1 Tax=Propionicicella superfundia TaxID=348582 RepID=UPI0003F60180|nr:prepilin peptidase [Propionicicella superfundia]